MKIKFNMTDFATEAKTFVTISKEDEGKIIGTNGYQIEDIEFIDDESVPAGNTGYVATGVRYLPKQEPRVETGNVQFGDDWMGLFLRGDTCAGFLMDLQTVLEGDVDPIVKIHLQYLFYKLLMKRKMNTTEKQNEGIPIITKKIWSKAKPLTVKPYEGQADCTCYLTTDQVFEIFKELAIPLDAVVMPINCGR